MACQAAGYPPAWQARPTLPKGDLTEPPRNSSGTPSKTHPKGGLVCLPTLNKAPPNGESTT